MNNHCITRPAVCAPGVTTNNALMRSQERGAHARSHLERVKCVYVCPNGVRAGPPSSSKWALLPTIKLACGDAPGSRSRKQCLARQCLDGVLACASLCSPGKACLFERAGCALCHMWRPHFMGSLPLRRSRRCFLGQFGAERKHVLRTMADTRNLTAKRQGVARNTRKYLPTADFLRRAALSWTWGPGATTWR